MRTCSTRNIEGCLCKSFSIQILGFKVTRDFAINNSRGCHVTSSCVINISTSRRLQMRCIRIIFNRVIIIKSTKFFDSKRCFNSRKCLSFTLWFCSYINHLRHLFKSFLSMFCLFAFFFLSSYNDTKTHTFDILATRQAKMLNANGFLDSTKMRKTSKFRRHVGTS